MLALHAASAVQYLAATSGDASSPQALSAAYNAKGQHV